MTPEETREAGQLMIDAADGKVEVQLRHKSNLVIWRVCNSRDIGWNWSEFSYRRAPKKPQIGIVRDEYTGNYEFEAVERTPEVIQALKDAGIEYE